jgi:hypothetical protein
MESAVKRRMGYSSPRPTYSTSTLIDCELGTSPAHDQTSPSGLEYEEQSKSYRLYDCVQKKFERIRGDLHSMDITFATIKQWLKQSIENDR